MRFKLRRPFGDVAAFRRGDEFFDWLAWYVVNSENGVSGMVWVDDNPLNSVDRVLEMGRQAFLLKYDETYAASEEDNIDTSAVRGEISDILSGEGPLEVAMRGDDFQGREMVTYAHKDNPLVRFRDFKGNEPEWAVDIQPI